MLEHGTVLVHVASTHPGVVLPARFMDRADVVLALHIAPPEDARVWCDVSDPTGIVATLVFDAEPFRCGLPWDSVFAAWSEELHEMIVWKEAQAMQIGRPKLQLVT